MGNNFTGGTIGQLKSYGTDSDQVYDGIKDVQDVETKFVKDFQGYVTTIVDAAGQTTKIERDFKGKPVKIIRPDGTEATFNYDPATDDLLSQTDTALGVTTSQTFDAFGNILTQRILTMRQFYFLVSCTFSFFTTGCGHRFLEMKINHFPLNNITTFEY